MQQMAVLGTAMGSGRRYECHKGHPYYVSGCGLPTGVVPCPDCGSPIGGNRHRHDNTNRPMPVHNIQGVAHEIVTDATAERIRNPYVEPPARDIPPGDIMLRRILAQLDAEGNQRVDLNEFLERIFPTDDPDLDEPVIAAGLPSGLRIGVAKALGRFGAPRHAAVLAAMCKGDVLSETIEVRQEATKALRELGAAGIPPATVARLAAMLSDKRWREGASQDWQIAGALIDTLGSLGHQAMEHNHALTEVLTSAVKGQSRGWETRLLAAAALGKRGPTLVQDEVAVAGLIKAVQTDYSWHVRRAAVLAMGNVGPGLAQYAWVVQKLGERDETVRVTCTDVLKQMGVTDPWLESKLLMADLLAEVVEEELAEVCEGVMQVSHAAAMRLGVVDVLARRLKSGTREDKWQGVQLVQRMGARAAQHANVVATLMSDPDEAMVRNAILALAAIGPKACAAMDEGGMSNVIVSGKEWETRAEAVQCVRVVAAARVAQMRLDSGGSTSQAADKLASRWASAVAPALADRHKQVRNYADRALGSLRVKAEAHVEDIATVLSNDDWHCRREACRLLGTIGKACSFKGTDEDVRKRLLELFRPMDTDGDLELSSEEVSRKLKQDFELQGLLKAMGREPAFVMEYLDSHSGTIKLTDFLEMFKPASEAQRLMIAARAAQEVATLGLMDARAEVRETATLALNDMGEDTAIKALTDRIAAAPDDESKIAAAEAMVEILSISGKRGGSMSDEAKQAAEATLRKEATALLQSSSWRVRAAGAASLGAAGTLAKSFLPELETLCDSIGSLQISGTPERTNLDGEYKPAPHDGESKVQLWKRTGHLGKTAGGMLVYDGGFQPCPRWVFVRGFEALTATALDDAIHGNTVHVGNLRGRYEEKESEVKEALNEFGQVLGITIRNRRHMQKPSWALVTFATRQGADTAVPLDSTPSATGAARQFWIAKIDSRQVAASTGGMGKTMRAHIAKLEEVQSQVDEVGWSSQWSTRRNVRSAEMREWHGKPSTWSLRQQHGNLLGVTGTGNLPADAPPRGGRGTKSLPVDGVPVGLTGWRFAKGVVTGSSGREEIAVRIDRNEPKEQSAAVGNAAKRAVVAINAAVAAAKAAEIAARLAVSGSDASIGEETRPQTPENEPAPVVKAELSEDELAELEALSRDQVADLLSSFSLDSDAGLVAASQKAHAAWQKAAKVVVVAGRGTRDARATSARSVFKAAVSRVNTEVGATNHFLAVGDESDMRIADLPPDSRIADLPPGL